MGGLKNCARCMGSGAALAVLKWATQWLPAVDTVVDPFCGAGTSLAVGNVLDLHAIGVDISARRVKQASTLDGGALIKAQAEDAKTRAGKATALKATAGDD